MKNSLTTFLLSFFLLVSSFKSYSVPTDIDTSECLLIEGHVPNACDAIDENCTVELLCSNTLVKSIVLNDGKKKFKFILKKNLNYAIRITKKDHITKLISIDTKMNKDPYGMKFFLFEARMIVTYDPAKTKDFQIAYIYYDSSKDDFIHDKEFTSKMKKEIAMK